MNAFNTIVDSIKNVINWLGKIKVPDVLGKIGGLFGGGKSAPVPAGLGAAGYAVYQGPSSAVAPRAAVGGASGATVINIQGGLDSADAIARRVQQAAHQPRPPGPRCHHCQVSPMSRTGVGVRVLIDGAQLDDGCLDWTGTPIYSPWVEQRRNLATHPRGLFLEQDHMDVCGDQPGAGLASG